MSYSRFYQRHALRCLLPYLYALLCAPAASMADSLGVDAPAADSTRVEQPESMVVYGRRLATEKSAVAHLDASTFVGRYADIPSVLEQISGVSVRRTGGFGEYADVSIRGGSPKQVQVFLDGIPLNSAGGGAVDLSKISLNSLQSITVYKGAAPLELMGNSAGGVIHLSTRTDKEMVSGIAEGGSYGYNKAGMFAHKRLGNVAHRLSVDYTRAKNDYRYLFDNNTRYNPDDDTQRRKQNSGYTQFDGTYAGSWDIAPQRTLEGLFSASHSRQELFRKALADGSQLASREVDGGQGYVRFEQKFGTLGFMSIRMDGRFTESVYDDPLGQTYLGGKRSDRERTPRLGLRLEGMGIVNDVLSLQLQLSGGWEGYASRNLLAIEENFAPFAQRLSASAAIECAAWWERLRLTLRYNQVYALDSANFDHALFGTNQPRVHRAHYPNASFDLVAELSPHLRVDAAVRHEFLPVTLSELYGWGNNTVGNADLRPERHSEASTGVSVELGRMYTTAAVFGGYTHDVISFGLQSQSVYIATNGGDQLSLGGEWEVRYDLARWLTLDSRFSYTLRAQREPGDTWQDARQPLYHSPLREVLSLSGALGPLTLSHSLDYRSAYRIGQTRTSDTRTPLPILTASLGWQLTDAVSLSYRIENYLDEAIETTPQLAPLPGVMHFGVLRVAL